MISPRDLYVKVGDLVIPAWRRLVAYLAGMPVLPGVGVLVTRTQRGTIISSRAFVRGFAGSWGIGTPGDKTVIGDGYVNGVMPSINGVRLTPVSASDPKRPRLKMNAKNYDESGRTWVCVEVEVIEASWRFDENDPKVLRIVQADHPFRTGDKLVGRHPLALFYRGKAGGFGELHRITYSDLQHRYLDGRHFFF